jgi:hypothetical protein
MPSGEESALGIRWVSGPHHVRLGWRTWIAVLAFYTACLAGATWPFAKTFPRKLVPSLFDPLQHLWVMKWYKVCLLEGRSPVLCPEIQYPIGAPLGNYSPLHLQALLYVPISLVFPDDVVSYNLVWLCGMLFTGVGTYLLIWHLVRHKPSACFGGMLAMLSGPMMLHGRAHLELIFLGGFPCFLVAWMRFVDRPGRGRLLAAAALYVLVALCAAYYVVFAIVPALLYVLWRGAQAARRREWDWFSARAGWLTAFAVLAVPALLLVFGNQLWSLSQGYSAPRPKSEFDRYGTALWTYVLPSPIHRLSTLLPFNPYQATDWEWSVGERVSYLGTVTLGLVHYAAVRKVRFARAGFCWALFGLLVLLSCGASWQLWSWQVSLPADWLKRYVFAFSPIRVPARFNLFAAVAAAVLAAAGLRDLLHRLPNRWTRATVFSALAAAAVFDLSTIQFEGIDIPRIPSSYAWIKARDPKATILELPHYASGGAFLYSVTSYWQTHHRITTNAGYSGQGNLVLDNLMTWQSPFQAEYLANPDFLKASYPATFGVTTNCDFDDYAWLFLKTYKFRYLVLHRWGGANPDFPIHTERLEARLRRAQVYEDHHTIVYDPELLPRPAHPALLCTDGWRLGWHEKKLKVCGRVAHMMVYNPDPKVDLRLGIEAKSLRQERIVRLKSGDRELARLTINPLGFQILQSIPFRLPAGTHELTLECDGEVRDLAPQEYAVEWDKQPYSLYVGGICLMTERPRVEVPQIATGPSAPARK